MSSGDDFKSKVLQTVDIVDLIGRSVALKRAGKDYKGLCPFHQEKSPSFTVNPARQFFYCYGCKAGGNAIDFVMKRDRLEFVDALRFLGEQVGLEMPRGGGSQQKSGERQVLLDMQSAACDFYARRLGAAAEGAAARDYLQKRGIDAESVKRFRIGLAPDAWDGLLSSPVGRKFAPEQLALGGLVKPRERGGGFYDTFRNRLMFPIRDESARVIAFGGREMPGSPPGQAKYLNSPETPLFSKGRCIFGIDLARQRITETRTAVVVEGYTDVVMAHQFEVQNVVSVLGTALTSQHVNVLRRFADRIVLLFDADTAGDVAVDKAVGLFLTQPVEIAIAAMPQGVDPDEFLLREGAEGFHRILAAAIDALSYKWKQLLRRFNENGNDLTGQQKAIEEYLQLLASARGAGPIDPLRWGSVLARVSRLTEIPVEQLNRTFRGTPPARDASPKTAPAAPPNPALTARDRAERWILGVLLLYPDRWAETQKQIGPTDFQNPRHRALAELYWNHQRDEGEPVLNEFLGLLAQETLVELAIEVVDEMEAFDDCQTMLGEALVHLKESGRRAEERKLVGELRRTSDVKLPETDEVALLKTLQDRVRQPDLRRA